MPPRLARTLRTVTRAHGRRADPVSRCQDMALGNAAKLVRTRFPQIRQIALCERVETGLQRSLVENVQHDQPLTLFLVRDGRDGKGVIGDTRRGVNLLFDLHVRHHLTADLAKAAQAVDDRQKPVLVQNGDVTGDIPAVLENLRRSSRVVPDTLASRSGRTRAADRTHRPDVGRTCQGPRCGR